MTFEETFVVKAPIDRVWRCVQDPVTTAHCVPGIEKLDVVDERTYDVVANARVSFLTVTFKMRASITVQEPWHLVSNIEGRETRLGERLRMTTDMRLAEIGPMETQITYRIEMTIFGRLASLGGTVIKGRPSRSPKNSPGIYRRRFRRRDDRS